MTFQLKTDGKITTTLYEKPMALHCFIPPHSAHPPGVLRSHIFGNILRIFRLNSKEVDITRATMQFLRRFLVRGHSLQTIKPIFLKAILNERRFMATNPTQRQNNKLIHLERASRRLYLHVEYHPQNPTSKQLQQMFHECLFHPPGEKPLNELEASFEKVPIDSMIVAYHQAKNFGDIFSYRDINKQHVPPSSSWDGGTFLHCWKNQLRWFYPAMQKSISHNHFCFTLCVFCVLYLHEPKFYVTLELDKNKLKTNKYILNEWQTDQNAEMHLNGRLCAQQHLQPHCRRVKKDETPTQRPVTVLRKIRSG